MSGLINLLKIHVLLIVPAMMFTEIQGLEKKPREQASTQLDGISIEKIFEYLDTESKGYVTRKEMMAALRGAGIQKNDPRIQDIFDRLSRYESLHPIDFSEFKTIVRENSALIERAVSGQLIIPNFNEFHQEIKRIYDSTKGNREGRVANYIPQLKHVDPEQYGLSVCTIDGQRLSIGDANVDFVVQSTSKPISYCLALEEHGEDYVHRHVGREPSGRGFNELTLNKEGSPHNPMINAGAIMTCSMIKPAMDGADRFQYALKMWGKLCGGQQPRFNNAVYLSERKTGDRNYALGYFMREKNAFPPNTHLINTLEYYFQMCSMEVTCEQMSVIAATLANAGVCPITGEKVFDPNNVKNCLSLMSSCGMYDFSGEFAFTVGIPAKSGVSGALLIVIPKVMGIAVWSPRLDDLGNSVRAVEFCKRLVNKFNFHIYDSLAIHTEKIDPRLKKNEERMSDGIVALNWASSQGDVHELKRLVVNGCNLKDCDYDGRTPIHLAASEGHENVIRYLIAKRVPLSPLDRWGRTPLDDAISGNHKEVAGLLKKNGAKHGKG